MKPFILSKREPNRDPTNAKLGFQRFNAQRRIQRKADRKRAMEFQEISVVGQDLPCCFVCAGRSLTWDGHPSCRGRTTW